MNYELLRKLRVGRADLLRVWQPGPPPRGTIWKKPFGGISCFPKSTQFATRFSPAVFGFQAILVYFRLRPRSPGESCGDAAPIFGAHNGSPPVLADRWVSG